MPECGIVRGILFFSRKNFEGTELFGVDRNDDSTHKRQELCVITTPNVRATFVQEKLRHASSARHANLLFVTGLERELPQTRNSWRVRLRSVHLVSSTAAIGNAIPQRNRALLSAQQTAPRDDDNLVASDSNISQRLPGLPRV